MRAVNAVLRPVRWPWWWTPEIRRQSQEHFELLTHCQPCGYALEDFLDHKWCPRCRMAWSPVPEAEELERQFVLGLLAAGRA